MYLDRRIEFRNGSVVMNIGNQLMPSSDVIDLTAVTGGRNIGAGESLALVIAVTTTFVGGAATVQFDLATGTNDTLSAGRVVHMSTGPLAVSTLTAGRILVYSLPDADYQRYMGIWQTVATANLTAGAVVAGIAAVTPAIKAYPAAVNL